MVNLAPHYNMPHWHLDKEVSHSTESQLFMEALHFLTFTCKVFFRKMEKLRPMCEAFRAYRKRSDATQGFAWNHIEGSLEKSLQCSCEYCILACSMLGKEDDIARYKEHNRKATADNSQIIFLRTMDPKESFQDVKLRALFVKSGLVFKTDPNQREVFVVDRQFLRDKQR